jgi:hypothetical protein
MTFSSISNVGSANLGLILKEISKGVIVDNLSTSTGMFDYVFGKPLEDPEGKKLIFEVRTALGSPAVQAMAMYGAEFPAGSPSVLKNGSAYHKKIGLTVELENSVIKLATKDFNSFGRPVALEVEAKGMAAARQLAMAFNRDGSGVIGSVSSVAASSNNLVVTLKVGTTDRGFVGWFDKGDFVKVYTAAGVQKVKVNGGVNAVSYFKVVSKSRSAGTVTLAAYTSAGVLVNVTSVSTADDVAADDLIYRFGTTANDLSGSITDYDVISEEILGLEAFTHSTGTVQGLIHGTDVDVSHTDCGAAAIESKFLQQALMNAELENGEGRYKYDFLWMQPEAYNALLEANEVDRRFQAVEMIRGAKELGFQFKGELLRFKTDPFIRGNRIWAMPVNEDVIQFHGTELEPVQAEDGPKWHLKTGTSAHKDQQQMYMSMLGLTLCNHPSAIIKISNYSVA